MEGRHTQHPDDGGVNLQNLPTADVSVVSNINEAATQIASIDDSSVHGDDETPKPDDTTISTAYTIFSKTQVATIVAIASWAASFSGLSSNIYFPSISAIAKDLDVTSELVNLTVTLYLVFQGLSPSVWAPLSDTKGRRTVILITFAIYFGANIGLALTKSYAQLAVLRAVQSSASASSVAIGAAIVGNVVERRHRAGYMGIFNAASLLATAIGPVIGGAMAESLGWRSILGSWLALEGRSGSWPWPFCQRLCARWWVTVRFHHRAGHVLQRIDFGSSKIWSRKILPTMPDSASTTEEVSRSCTFSGRCCFFEIPAWR